MHFSKGVHFTKNCLGLNIPPHSPPPLPAITSSNIRSLHKHPPTIHRKMKNENEKYTK